MVPGLGNAGDRSFGTLSLGSSLAVLFSKWTHIQFPLSVNELCAVTEYYISLRAGNRMVDSNLKNGILFG
ncbi:hypothetical protein DsansV1_C01g0000481 [Dioscorea sansibarensis]